MRKQFQLISTGNQEGLGKNIMSKRIQFFFLIVLVLPAVLASNCPLAYAEAIALQLKWTHAFQFAGYYAAQEKGFYKEAGLDVNILEGDSSVDSTTVVLDGKAQYGVGTTSLLLQRNQGKPVVVLGVILQHSPYVLLARKHGADQNIHDLVGRKISIEAQADEIIAYLNKEGLTQSKLQIVKNDHDIKEFTFGNVEAMSAYITVEPFQLDLMKFPYAIYSPRASGIDFYGDNLFTTEDEISRNPRRVRAFLDASIRGWMYAMAHPEEIADVILDKYSTKNSRDFLINEATQMKKLMQTDLIGIGYMNPGRWRHIAETYSELGLLPRNVTLEGFLYAPKETIQYTLLIRWGLIAFGILSIAGGISYYFSKIARRARESEERHRLLADNASDVIWTMDLQGRFTYVSPSVEQLRGFTADEVMQQTFDDALTPESARVAKEKFKEMVDAVKSGNPLPSFRGELEQPCKNGNTVWTEVITTSIVTNDHQFVGILGVTRDISARRFAEDELRISENKWKAIINTSPDGIAVASLDGLIVQVNAKILSMFGYANDEDVIGRNINDFVHPDYREKASRLLGEMLNGNYSGPSDYLVMRKDGSTFFIESNAEVLRNSNGEPVSLILVDRDITERKRVEQKLEEYRNQLEKLSITDGLTGVFNRRHFDHILEQEYARHARSGAELSVVMLDIDFFKNYNDSYGHIQGDICLQNVAMVISEHAARPADLVARYGGEEFVCILPETDHHGAFAVAENIRRGILALTIGHKSSSISNYVTASLGVVTSKCMIGGSAKDFVSQADSLLYQAKSNGRNCIESDSYHKKILITESDKGYFVQLIWKDSFCSGNDLIDSQHQSLFRVANELLDASLLSRSSDEISGIIATLIKDISQHFVDEERILRDIEFPGLSKQKKEHSDLFAKCAKILDKYNASELAVGDVFQFLAYDVVMLHMLGSDREYLPYIGNSMEDRASTKTV